MLACTFVAVAVLSVLPNHDSALQLPATRALPDDSAARAVLATGWASQVDSRFGLPSVFFAERTRAWPSPREIGLTPEQVARRALFTHAPLYRAEAGALAGLELAHVHDTGTGAVVVSFARRIEGLPLLRERVSVVLTRGLELVAITGSVPMSKVAGSFRLTLGTALAVAVQDLTGRWPGELLASPVGRPAGEWQRLEADRRLELADAPYARRGYFALADELLPAIELVVRSADGNGWLYVVSAHDGQLLLRTGLTRQATHSLRAYLDASPPFTPQESPAGTATWPHPTGTPDHYSPALLPAPLVTLDSSTLPRSTEWLPAGATELKGNAAWAYIEAVAPDGFNAGDVPVPPSAAGAFDWTYDLSQSPGSSSTQNRAAATNAFAVSNWLHDWFESAGFEPSAGSAQEDNFDGGGVGGDRLMIGVDDPFLPNNAYMTVLPDGIPPIMRVGIFSNARVQRVVALSSGADAGVFGGRVSSAAAAPTFSFTGTPVLADSPNTDGGTGCTHYGATPSASGKVAVVGPLNCFGTVALAHALDAGAVGMIVSGRLPNTPAGLFFSATPTPPPALGVTPESYALLAAGIDAGTIDTVVLETQAAPRMDGSLDNAMLAHEYTHLVTGRLIGDTSGFNTLASIALAEGWADFGALLALTRADDAAGGWSGAFPFSAYSNTGFSPDGSPNDAFYFGARRYPYSTDLTKNGLSFRHIQDGEPLPAGGTLTGSTVNSESHNAGEVWASMLWEGYTAVLRDPRHTFAAARDFTASDFIAGFKATPPRNAAWLEARDALLAVVAARDAADAQLWLQGFTRRGLGLDAVQPDLLAIDFKPVVEDSSSSGARAHVVSVTADDAASSCDHDGVAGAGESVTLEVKVFNRGFVAISGATLGASTATAGATLGTTPVPLPTIAPFTTATVDVPLTLARRFAGTVVRLVFSPRGGVLGASDQTWELPAAVRQLPSATETWTGMSSRWTADSEPTGQLVDTLDACQKVSEAGPNDLIYCPNLTRKFDLVLDTPEIDVGPQPLRLSFRHAWSLDVSGTANNAWDGVVLQMAVSPATTFTNVPAMALSPPYPGTIYASSGATLKGAPAWVTESPNFPALVDQRVDLGTAYAGKKVRFRFRVSTDGSVGKKGWRMDDFAVEGATMPPFFCFVRDEGLCGNKPPVVVVGADFSADEGTVVTLPLTSATDGDGDPIDGGWSQISGAMVSLEGAAFTAPMASSATPLGFRYTASDGLLSGSDDVTVTVQHINLPPVVLVDAPATAEVGAQVTLTASATDPEGSAVTLSWAQVEGPAVELDALQGGQVHFTVPKTKSETVLTFEVTGSDGTTTGSARASTKVLAPGCGCGTGGGGAAVGLLLLALKARRRRRLLRSVDLSRSLTRV